jgi:hypothetical protein
MSRQSKVWLVLAVLFTLGNAIFALVPEVRQDPMHDRLHVTLSIVGAFAVWQLIRRRDAAGDRQQDAAGSPGAPSALSGRLMQLEQSVDAVAIEVERIGEGQRFVTRVLAGKDTAPPPREGTASPIVGDARRTLHTTPQP